jgi:hypothetical protein
MTWIDKIKEYKQDKLELFHILPNETLDYAILFDNYKPTEAEIKALAQELWDLTGIIFERGEESSD